MARTNGSVAIIGERVTRRRTEIGLTQAELAVKAKCNERTVQRAETGARVRLGTARDIAEALDVELRTIILLKPASDDERLHDIEEWPSEPRRIDNDTHEDRVVAAFRAANDAIRKTLDGAGEYGMKELTEVLSLLATRYGFASFNAVPVDLEQGTGTNPTRPSRREEIALPGEEVRNHSC